MKRQHIIALLLFVVIVGGVAAFKYRPRTVPWDECSELYRRYSDVPGVEATYVKDYPVNDTLSIGVTILQATDSGGWERLTADFEISEEAQKTAEPLKKNGNNVLSLCGNKTTTMQVVVASLRDNYFCVFHTYDMEFQQQIKTTIYKHIFKSVKTNQKISDYEKNI